MPRLLVAGVVHKHSTATTCSCFGGDEFLIACADALDETAQLADSIRRAVVDEAYYVHAAAGGLSLSIGIARASSESVISSTRSSMCGYAAVRGRTAVAIASCWRATICRDRLRPKHRRDLACCSVDPTRSIRG